MLVIPVYNRLIIPDADIYFQTEHFKQQAGRAVMNEKVVILILKEDIAREEMSEESFYPIAAYGVISDINNDGFVTVHTTGRVTLDMVGVNPDTSIDLTITKKPDEEDITGEELGIRLTALKKAVREFSADYSWGEATSAFVDSMASIGSVASMLSPWIQLPPEEKYALLEENSLKKRTAHLEKILYEFLEVAKVQNNAATAQQKEYQEMYRESAIKKQMEFLQRELDEMHPEQVSDIRKFEKKIAGAGMNETARAEAEKVLNRLKQEGKNSPETGMLYDYLDFITSLSWKKEQAGPISLKESEEILNRGHYGLRKVKRRILEQIAVMNLKREQAGSILLFVGAPGTGKTSIGKSIADALHREYIRVSLGGIRDEADIRGHRRTYIGAMPGRIMDGIAKSGVSNPVMVLDEVDKIASSYHGDPASALLELLDPEQNNTFTDHYLNVPYDLSDVLFICTANATDTIPEPLLNRMEVISFDGYTPLEKLSIAKEHLLPKAMDAMGIRPEQMEISDEVLRTLIADYTREAGVRGLRKRVDALCRAAAVQISKTENLVFSLKPEEIREALDITPIRHERTDEAVRPGIITGLAWTSAGGEILYIETLFTKGKGGLIITGRLGDVMKESAQIAVSLIKSMFPEKAKLFSGNDLHIHVPEGAVPKDGPSAGITLATALASLVTGKAVSPKIAMTGEISLRGMVTPIGGLPEKLMAAQRAGVTKALIPEENKEDLRDVPEEVKKAMEIIPIKEVKDALRETGILQN